MTVTVVPHLNFRGDARAALEFYRSAFGGELVITTYRDMGAVEDPAEADQVVWGQVTGPNGFAVMAYDVPASRPWSRGDDPFFVSVRGTDAVELTAAWERLADGGSIRQPLGPAPWAPLYGMLTDRFGVTWVLDIAAQP
ncbi:VOC family protein [Jiangella ureilytica]|uniref:VOC family protein n=1 Tax=Jiangella ureilytica TaxID=2530374 RepID=A0A4V2XXL4_9ACTN|nr:VOC family protein [Jiangella ureilytica]TDC53775.1 VOC family protein [Jiangella ureilytica]